MRGWEGEGEGSLGKIAVLPRAHATLYFLQEGRGKLKLHFWLILSRLTIL